MTGDNLETDMPFGANNGIDSLLVLTGNSNQAIAERVCVDGKVASVESKPTYV